MPKTKVKRAWTAAQRKKFLATIKAKRNANADYLPEPSTEPQVNWKLKYYQMMRELVNLLILNEENKK